MIDLDSPTVTEFRHGSAMAIAGLVVSSWVVCGWPLVIWPLVALAHHVAVWPAAAYLTVLAGLIAASTYRGARGGTRMDNSGLVIRGWLRSWRLGWPQVAQLTDGCDFGGVWVLTVLLNDGRAINCPATSLGPLAERGKLTQVRQVAARYGVREDLGGIGAPRPRAWEDAVAVARRYRTRLGIWLLVAAAAVAGLVVVWVWNVSRPDYGPVPVPLAYIAAGAVVAAGWALRWRRQALREGSGREDDRAEGDWFSLSLTRNLHAVGVVARRPPRCTVMLAYFFGPFESARPAMDTIGALRPADALLVSFATARFWDGRPAGRRGSWALLGRAEDWDRAAWPVPVFTRTDPEAKQSFKILYDDQLRFVREEPADGIEVEAPQGWGFFGSAEGLGAELRKRLAT